MKPATNAFAGFSYTSLRLAELLDHAVAHHRDPVGHRQRLLLVVGDVDERDADLALDPLQLDLHLLAQLQVQRAERLELNPVIATASGAVAVDALARLAPAHEPARSPPQAGGPAQPLA